MPLYGLPIRRGIIPLVNFGSNRGFDKEAGPGERRAGARGAKAQSEVDCGKGGAGAAVTLLPGW